MTNEINVSNEISLVDIVLMIVRNLKIVLIFTILFSVLSISISFITVVLFPTYNRYAIDSYVSIQNSSLSEQNLTLINYTFSHPTILTRALRRIRLDSNEYSLSTVPSGTDKFIIFRLEGPDVETLNQLSNQVLRLTKPILENSFDSFKLEIISVSSPETILVSTRSTIDWIFRFVSGIVAGNVIAYIYIISVYLYRFAIIPKEKLLYISESRIFKFIRTLTHKSKITKHFIVY